MRFWYPTKTTSSVEWEWKSSIDRPTRGRHKIWILASHPEKNILAAGCDTGFLVWKLKAERPIFSVCDNALVYIKDKFIHQFNYSTQKDIQLIPIHLPKDTGRWSISYSPTDNAALFTSNANKGFYELYTVPKDIDGTMNTGSVHDVKRGTGGSVVFLAPSMFAVLEKSNDQIVLKNLDNEIVRKITLPIHATRICYAGIDTLLCRGKDGVFIFDLKRCFVLGNLEIPGVKHIVWSHALESVALLCRNSIVTANKRLEPLCTVNETRAVKSGAWDVDGVFIYSTTTHIKFCLPGEDSGIIKSLDVPLYINKVCGDKIFALDRDGQVHSITFPTEYLLKLALIRKRYDQVMDIIMNAEFSCHKSIITYLLQTGFPKSLQKSILECLLPKGFPTAASHFARDKQTRSNLALEEGNMQSVCASAAVDDWNRLAEDALRKGFTGFAEYAYLSAKNFGRLSFIYLITGKLDKLSLMMKQAEVENNVMAQFHDALFLGDIQERVKLLENAGRLPLAYITASVHGLQDMAERLAAELEHNVPSLLKRKSAFLLIPPKPILLGHDWPNRK